MINTVDVKFIAAVNKNTIKELKGLSPTEANLIIPSDGFIRLGNRWKVEQIIKDVDLNEELNEIHLTVYVYLNKVTQNDYCLL